MAIFKGGGGGNTWKILKKLATKEARQARQGQLIGKNEFYEATAGQLYGAGIAD